jgi:hypothetical protein
MRQFKHIFWLFQEVRPKSSIQKRVCYKITGPGLGEAFPYRRSADGFILRSYSLLLPLFDTKCAWMKNGRFQTKQSEANPRKPQERKNIHECYRKQAKQNKRQRRDQQISSRKEIKKKIRFCSSTILL